MSEWHDEAIILRPKPFGENDCLLSVMTKVHGRSVALVKHGQSSRLKAHLQAGTKIQVTKRARLDHQLGRFIIEPIESMAPEIMLNHGRLLAIGSALSLLEEGMDENEPQPNLYENLAALLLALQADTWPISYVKWEIALLREWGFGLDLSQCAASGETQNLKYISPKSGRAVSAQAGQPYHDRLLPLPDFLTTPTPSQNGLPLPPASDMQDALVMSGYFLSHGPFAEKPLPPMRHRLQSFFSKKSA